MLKLAFTPDSTTTLFYIPKRPIRIHAVVLMIEPNSTLDARDLCAFQTQTCHKALLVKNEGVSVIFQCGR
ncbi:hypothetical protein CARN8_6530001 [mine drainage metagenome]|uniref:Uncharacterized protein n=1 Tax=mine drainage metagenome TaxID=410659 RepID=A0A3P3ZR56_9ZZZZ